MISTILFLKINAWLGAALLPIVGKQIFITLQGMVPF
jgi:hypothetical protein